VGVIGALDADFALALTAVGVALAVGVAGAFDAFVEFVVVVGAGFTVGLGVAAAAVVAVVAGHAHVGGADAARAVSVHQAFDAAVLGDGAAGFAF